MSRQSGDALTDLLRSPDPDVNRIIDLFVSAFNDAYGRDGAKRWDVSKEDWQRFEFLGDRVLNLVVAQYLYSQKDTFLSEGEMTRILSGIVSNKSLGNFVKESGISVERLIPPTIGAQKTYRERITGGAFEALIGALYCERGLDDIAFFIISLFEKRIRSLDPHQNAIGDLQEYFQKRRNKVPDYDDNPEGPDNQRTWHSRVTLHEGRSFDGTGKDITESRQVAARKALEYIRNRLS